MTPRASTHVRFRELLQIHLPDWMALARDITRDHQHAEDAVAEALMAFHRALDAGQDIRTPAAWIATVLRNRARERVRNENAQRRMLTELKKEMTPSASGENSAPGEIGSGDWADPTDLPDRATVLRLLPLLGERQREVIRLRLEHGLSHGEIAREMPCAESTVRTLQQQAVKRLRELMAEQSHENIFDFHEIPPNTQ